MSSSSHECAVVLLMVHPVYLPENIVYTLSILASHSVIGDLIKKISRLC